MNSIFGRWIKRSFSDPQAILLALFLIIGFSVVLTMGQMLMPVLASIVIAYLLEGIVAVFEKRGAPRLLIIILVLILFMLFLVFILFGLLPLVSNQIAQLIKEIPNYLSAGQLILTELPERYGFISDEQITELMATIRSEGGQWGQRLVSFSLASIPGLITLVVYFILMPVLIFFFLNDKEKIIGWVSAYLPRERQLLVQVWEEMDMQIGNYVRGKFWEILIMGVVTYLGFALLGIKYAMLLSVLVGLSVLVPYIGAAVVTFPVIIIAYFQWGWGTEFAYLMIFYGITQVLDGNVLVPLLFSEVVNLHPVAIIVAVLFFGGLWGFWGVFFAIPLATLVSAVLRAWPRNEEEGDQGEAESL